MDVNFYISEEHLLCQPVGRAWIKDQEVEFGNTLRRLDGLGWEH